MKREATRFDEAIGQAIRRHREERGLTQDLLGGFVKTYGPAWTGATVAAVETGRRRMTPVELMVVALRLHVGLPDLLRELGHVEYAPGATADGEAFALIAEGNIEGAFDDESWDTPAGRTAADKIKRAPPRIGEWFELQTQYQLRLRDAEKVEQAAAREAERKAARAIGVSPLHIAAAAFKLWGHGLTDERDSRIDQTAEARTIQAQRGHVSRQLLGELRELIG